MTTNFLCAHCGDATMNRRHDDGQVGGDHYSRMDVTPWEFLASCLTPEEFRGYLKGEAIVYLARERAKGGPVDVGKARHTLQRLEALDYTEAVRPKANAKFLDGRWVDDGAGKQRTAPIVPECVSCAGKPCQRMDACSYDHTGL
jgi:Protein of unknwon function (DUF3310)